MIIPSASTHVIPSKQIALPGSQKPRHSGSVIVDTLVEVDTERISTFGLLFVLLTLELFEDKLCSFLI